jgi:hypothetical protein
VLNHGFPVSSISTFFDKYGSTIDHFLWVFLRRHPLGSFRWAPIITDRFPGPTTLPVLGGWGDADLCDLKLALRESRVKVKCIVGRDKNLGLSQAKWEFAVKEETLHQRLMRTISKYKEPVPNPNFPGDSSESLRK